MRKRPHQPVDPLAPDGPLWTSPPTMSRASSSCSRMSSSSVRPSVERVQAGYPDCVAYQNGKRVRNRIRVSLPELRVHRHDPRSAIGSSAGLMTGLPSRSASSHELRREFGLASTSGSVQSAEYFEGPLGCSEGDPWSIGASV